ncbi:MAG: response regulator [Proteobacteria bacterium]|nr:response regulator [Pseudomonadota bacterium]
MEYLRHYRMILGVILFLVICAGFSFPEKTCAGVHDRWAPCVYAASLDSHAAPYRLSTPQIHQAGPGPVNVSGFDFVALLFAFLVPVIIIIWNRRLSREMSGHEKTKRALLQSRELFKRTFVQAPLGAAIIDDRGNFVTVNTKLTQILGYDEKELIHRNIFEMTHPDDETMIREHYKTMKGGDVDYCYFTTRCIHKNGGILWAHISVRPIYDATSHPAFFLPMIEDITESKQNEDALKKLSRAVEQSPVSVVMTDLEGNIEYVNPKFTDVTGYSQEEALGQNPRILSSGRQDQAFYKNLWDTILAGEIWQGEIINKKKSGELYWEFASISPVRNQDGNLIHFVAVKEDITERKKTDQAFKKQYEELKQTKQNMTTVMKDLEKAKIKAEEATRAKGEFLANMSHEIRTPMNAIIGMSHLALQTDVTDQQKDYLSKIQSSSHSLLTIINDILDFSKIEAGKLFMEKTDFDLEELLEQVASLIHMKAGEKNLELLVDIMPGLHTRLIGDPFRLSQILTNLADNAVKFTHQGEIVLGVEKQKESGGDLVLKFWVQDTGIGMTPAQRKKLFRPFTQADTSTTRTYGGTGLGLSICKHLVEMMDGQIGVDSEKDKGSTFYFTARLGLQEDQKPLRFVLDEDLKGKRALVVDDNALARKIMDDQLSLFGFDVTLAESGPDALEQLAKKKPDQAVDMIFMDYKMPVMNGLECIRTIRGRTPRSKGPKIFMVTAYGDEGIQARAQAENLDGFLVKPLSPSILFDALMKAFGKDEFQDTHLPVKWESDPGILTAISGARVLLVEDNEINTQVAVELLERVDVRVVVASNGKQAVEAVESQPFDAVLMDVQMPVMDGLEATQEIRKRAHMMPIIAMTAHAMAGDREKSIGAGMNDHITKPVNPDELFSVLAKWIGKDGTRQPAMVKSPVTLNMGYRFMAKSYPGVSFEKGLKHTGGNHGLYKKIMGTFIRDYSNASDLLLQCISHDDFEGAGKLAHTIKGVSGNIGAGDLYKVSSHLEKMIRDLRTSELNDALNQFQRTLSIVLDSLGKMMAEDRIHETMEKLDPSNEEQSLKDLLHKLKPLIAHRNPKACRDLVKDIEKISKGSPYAQDLLILGDRVKRYQYEDAGPVLASLISRMEGDINHDRSQGIDRYGGG